MTAEEGAFNDPQAQHHCWERATDQSPIWRCAACCLPYGWSASLALRSSPPQGGSSVSGEQDAISGVRRPVLVRRNSSMYEVCYRGAYS